jgi:acylphosphatase
VTRRFIVTGRVQGVGFRFFVQQAAEREGVGGWVGNTEDGAVEAVAHGEPEAIARFEAALWQGPALARVAGVRSEALASPEPAGPFVIR